MQYEFTTDYPPSVNGLYVTGRDGRKHLTRQHVDFRKQIRLDVLEQCGIPQAIKSSAELTITLTPGDRRKRDIDNGLKAILDGLQKARLINDDKQIKKLNVVMNERDLSQGGKCQIMLKAIN